MAKPNDISACWLAVIFIGLLATTIPARADDIDPFQTDTGQWMSFQRYKDSVKRGLIVPPENPVVPETTLAPQVNETNPIAAPATNAEVAGASSIAAPTRPLMLPVMPGMNKGFNVQIDTTMDDKKAEVINLDSSPTLHLQSQNWENAQDAARAKNKDDGEHSPLNIRMSFLPSSKITPTPESERKSTRGHMTPAPAA